MFEVLADDYKSRVDQLEQDQLEHQEAILDRLDRTERVLTTALTLLTDAHERITHLCDTVEAFEQATH